MLQLIADGHTVKQAPGDADTLIVKIALQIASSGSSVNVFAIDTDVIIMLLHHCKADYAKIIVKSEYTHKGYKHWKQMNVNEACQLFKTNIRRLLPFIHAFGGCDTMSSIFDKGKNAIM